jgi:hypothetical protein
MAADPSMRATQRSGDPVTVASNARIRTHAVTDAQCQGNTWSSGLGVSALGLGRMDISCSYGTPLVCPDMIDLIR